MTEIPDVQDWATCAAEKMRDLVAEVGAARPPRCLGRLPLSFNKLAEMAPDAIEQLTESIQSEKDRCVYVITLDENVNQQDLLKEFSIAKGENVLNLPQNNEIISSTLYVGSCFSTDKHKNALKKRLQQHFGRNPTRTYALWLPAWASELKGGIVITAWQYSPIVEGQKDDQPARAVLLAVEDWLASELKPMLGRRGSRN